MNKNNLEGKVTIVIGASRGIGMQIAKTFAEAGSIVIISAKTTEANSKLKGTIYDVEKDINENIGQGRALAIPCDVRDESQIKSLVDKVIQKYGRISYLLYISGAIWWDTIQKTPLKRFDLMHSVNVRGAYATIEAVLPHMQKNSFGHIILCSPPIYSRFFKGKGAYAITKVGMSILTMTLAQELKGTNIAVNAFWPASPVKSQVTDNKNVNDQLLRKPTICADACLLLVQENPMEFTGNVIIDEDYLRSKGVTDFRSYNYSDLEPIRMMPKKFPSLRVEEEDEEITAKL